MALPVNFNPSENLQDLLRKIHNRKVKEKFREEIDIEGTTPESVLKRNCLINDDDSSLDINLKLWLFHYYCLENLDQISDNFYGIPQDNAREFIKPQLFLQFRESRPFGQNRTAPKRMNITTHVIADNPSSVTQNDINKLETRIRQNFPSSFSHYCGKIDLSYYDRFSKFRMVVPCGTESQGKILIQKICEISEINFDSNLCRKHEFTDYRTTQGSIRILGENKPKYRKRILGSVKLKKAILHLGQYEKISLDVF